MKSTDMDMTYSSDIRNQETFPDREGKEAGKCREGHLVITDSSHIWSWTIGQIHA